MAISPGQLLFLLEGSLVDPIGQKIPNYRRGTNILMHRVVDEGVQLYPIEADHPSIFHENSAIYLEPPGLNLLSHNIALDASVWTLGSPNSITVRRDLGDSPDGSFLADQVAFFGSNPSPDAADQQTISREILLESEADYVLRLLVKLAGGEFSRNATNVLTVSGDVAEVNPAYLADLNDLPERYQWMTCTFKTGGKNPVEVYSQDSETPKLTVSSLSGATVALQLSGLQSLAANDLEGGQVRFISQAGDQRDYLIASNQASVGNSVTVELATGSNPQGDGFSTSSDAYLIKAPLQNVKIELYSTSNARIFWGGIFLEKGIFPTSPIYQKEELFARDGVTLEYLESPIEGRQTFGIFIDLWYWEGDGNVVDIENFNIKIEDGDLIATAGSVTATAPDLPKDAAVFVQVSSESSSMSLYVNQVLVERVGLSSFAANLDAMMVFTTEGVRAIRRFLVTDFLLDGQIDVGETVLDEVLELFTNPDIVDLSALTAKAPTFLLPPVTLPPMTPPTAQTLITGINSASRTLTVTAATGFVANTLVDVYRGVPGLDGRKVVQAEVVSISGNNIVLNSVDEVLIDDFLVYGDFIPGKASVRYPYIPVDPQEITGLNGDWISVESAVSFSKRRAFVQTEDYVDVAEVIVEEVDEVGGRVRVDRVDNIPIGARISQPKPGRELLVSPACLGISALDPVNGVTVAKYENGLELTNANPEAVIWRGIARVYL